MRPGIDGSCITRNSFKSFKSFKSKAALFVFPIGRYQDNTRYYGGPTVACKHGGM